MSEQEQCKGKPREYGWWSEVGVLECLIEDEGEEDEDCVACLEIVRKGRREDKAEGR